MRNGAPNLLELTDLWCEDQLELLEPLGEMVMTVYGVPNKLGDVEGLKKRFPWVTFGMHGFECTPFECLTWTEGIAKERMQIGLDLGYAPLLLPPAMVYDEETAKACRDLGVTLRHSLVSKVFVPGLRAFPGPKGSAARVRYMPLITSLLRQRYKGWIGNHPAFRDFLRGDGGITPLDAAVEVEE